MNAIYPVILSGGSGTRLWPLSRAMYPKQFIRFFNGQGSSFLGATLERLSPAQGFNPPLLLCNNDHRFLVEEELKRTGITASAIILEPVARNTAAALAVAALYITREDPNGIMVVMPSDHAIQNEKGFVEAVQKAAVVASAGRLALFGIKPTDANTGYGYIRQGTALDGSNGGAFKVHSFAEKPDRKTAEKYLAEGGYFWNSGIFVLHARTFVEEMAKLAPRVLDAARAGLAGAVHDLGFLRLDKAGFAAAPSISVDYAVMEKTDAAVMLPIDVGWNDVGSWSSLWDIAPRDADENFVNGDALLEDTHGCYIHSERSLVSTIGVENLVIIDTPDALLVADKSRSQEVSALVQRLKHEQAKRARAASAKFAALGLFRDAVDRQSLPSQIAAREAGRTVVAADASSSVGALGRGPGHRQGHGRR